MSVETILLETMETILLEKENKKKELYIQQKKVFEIENQIIELDKKLASFSDNTILENLKLSEQQENIVNATEDYILVVACPGSGKTHTLISRYIRMILTNLITPDSTLLITFTKKAGMEMLNRLSRIIPHKLPRHVGSLHGLGYKILQEYAHIMNGDKGYSVLDEKDVTSYLKDLFYDTMVIKHFETYDEDTIHLLRSKIQLVVDMASTTYPMDIKMVLRRLSLEQYLKEFTYLHKTYQMKKKKENIVDFNDLMIMFAKFLDSPESEEYKRSIQYVFFDEYQDVNPVQNYILKKFAQYSKIMVVGDDAQSIYSFRGSSVHYILNFEKEFNDTTKTRKMYLLEENYRSTPHIVDFCQDIIAHNKNQFVKSVVSKQDKVGMKPMVYSFKSFEEQYKWVVQDIKQKVSEGVSLSQMVVLARRNNLLNNIELHCVGEKIQVAKNLGSSLLDCPHIKDFMAWLVVLINMKSSIHWKRIISLYPGYGVKRANMILELDGNIMKAISIHIAKEKEVNPQYIGLTELYQKMLELKKMKSDIEKCRHITTHLQKLWIIKKESNIDGKVMDINNLMNYMKTSKAPSIENFVTDLYLNQEIETDLANVLYLTTVHGAKGLEWDYVYIIDMDSSTFPSIHHKYYTDELNETDEERRLFYVAASRAKKYLYMTFHQELGRANDRRISPLVRELKCDRYNSCGVEMSRVELKSCISADINTYLRYIGYSDISEQMLQLVNIRGCVNKSLEFPSHVEKLGHRYIVGNFMDHLISKMIQISFPKKIKKFDLPIVHKDQSFPKKIYNDYIDVQTDWRNILEHIFYISTYKKALDEEEENAYREFLVENINTRQYYIEMEKGLCKIINTIKPKEIQTHFNCSLGDVLGEIDILCDDTIIEVKCSTLNEIATVPYLGQVLLYGYLLKKKNIVPKNMILYNPLNGETNTFDISNFDLGKFKNTIYKKPSS